MKIFVVNLKDSVERKASITTQLDRLGLPHEFIEAVDGRAMTDSERLEHTQTLNYAFLPGEIGCAMSHQKIYWQMISENIHQSLILEDDASLSANLAELLPQIDLSTKTPEVMLLSRVNKYQRRSLSSLSGGFSVHKVENATTTHAYVINLPAAKNLLKNLYPIWMVADKWSLFEDLNYARIYSVIPHPVTLAEEASASTINIDIDEEALASKKRDIWDELMKRRPFAAKARHRYRRAITPLFHKVLKQK